MCACGGDSNNRPFERYCLRVDMACSVADEPLWQDRECQLSVHRDHHRLVRGGIVLHYTCNEQLQFRQCNVCASNTLLRRADVHLLQDSAIAGTKLQHSHGSVIVPDAVNNHVQVVA